MEIKKYFKEAIEKKASDLHLVEGSAPTLRIAGELTKISQDILSGGQVKRQVSEILDKKQHKLIKLYFYPQGRDKEWLSQKDVVKKVPNVKIWKIRKELVEALMNIWEETKE